MFQKLSISPKQTIYLSDVKYDRETELLQKLKKKGLNIGELNLITNARRRSEWLTIREIIIDAMGEGEDILYDTHGKPYFKKSSFHLSISHSHHKVAICVHHCKNVGIDIQLISNKVLRIKDKFLNKLELEKVNVEETELTAYWSLKEALFKIYGKGDAYLKENFEIKDFLFKQNKGSAKGLISVGTFKAECNLRFQKIEDYMMAYSVNY